MPKGLGRVTMKTFENALNLHKVHLGKEEINQLFKKFQEQAQPDTINYCKLSKCLGLHNNALELIRPTTSFV